MRESCRRGTRHGWSAAIAGGVLFLLAASSVLADAPDYGLEVSRIFVKGAEVSTTDAAEQVVAGATAEVASRDRLPAGAVVRVFYPEVQIHLTGPNGSHVVLECAKCSPSQPLELTVGDPAGKVPFRQKHGNVTYDVETQEDGWFEILLEVLRGPDEVVVPVAVRGTRFLLAPDLAESVVTVADGMVEVGREGTTPGTIVEKGMSLAGNPGTFKVMPASPGLLKYMDNIMGPAPTMLPSPGKAGPVPHVPMGLAPPPVDTASGASWPQWLVVGGGAVAVGAGGVLHFLAYKAEADAAAEARELCNSSATQVGKAQAHLQADEQYDKLYDDNVRPLEVSALALYGTGAAMIVGGVIWHLAKSGGATQLPVSWHMVPLPDRGLSLGAGWTF